MQQAREVRKERTTWRDEKISQRHRLWGWDCPAVDVDFLMVEYDRCKVVGLVEYKCQHYSQRFFGTPTCLALVDLANKAEVPFFFTVYATDFSCWDVTPLNNYAKKFIPQKVERWNEWQWVALLYRIRGRVMPEELWDACGWRLF